MHVYHQVYWYVCKKEIRFPLQELCILIIGILYLLTLSSCDSTEFKGNPFSGRLAVKPLFLQTLLHASVALIELGSEVVPIYSHFSYISSPSLKIPLRLKRQEKGWSPEYLHQTHTCLFIPPGPARDTQLRRCKIRNESINVSTFPSV